MTIPDLGGRISVAAQKAMAGGPFRSLEGRFSQLRIIDNADGSDHILFETTDLIEAPNWAPDGQSLYLNGHGGMFRLDMESGASLQPIDIGRVADANNDHVISPDGRTLYISAGGAVYSVPAKGGEPYQLTPEGRVRFFLHGVSPDGEWLACTTIDMGSIDERWGIQIVPARGGRPQALLLGCHPVDGPEWSRDGKWIWFNGELDRDAPGRAQIFRMNSDGTDIRQMLRSGAVDWFPHPSPDMRDIAFLRYPPDTVGHPPDKPVELWKMRLVDGALDRLATFPGGQGSLNVNSWSPDGSRLAYVAYPPIEASV